MQPPIYDSISTKPTQSVGTVTSGNNQAKTILSSATNPFATLDRATVDYRQFNSNHESNYAQNYHTLTIAPTSSSTVSDSHPFQSKQLLDFRHQTSGTKFNDEFGSSTRITTTATNNGTDPLNLSNSSIANQLLPNTNGGGGGGGGGVTRHNLVSSSATISSTNKELNRNHHSNRNHIITDSLPGPESCV